MKNLLVGLLLCIVIVTSVEIQLGRRNRVSIVNGIGHFDLREELVSGNNLTIRGLGYYSQVYIAHETFTKEPNANRYQYMMSFSEARFTNLNVDFGRTGKKGKYYLQVITRTNHATQIQVYVTKKTKQIELGNFYKSSTGDANYGFDVISARFSRGSIFTSRYFRVSLEVSGPVKDGFINDQKIEQGKKNYYFFGTTGVSLTIEGGNTFHYIIKIDHIYVWINTYDRGLTADSFYSGDNLQHYYLTHVMRKDYFNVYIEPTSPFDVEFQGYINFHDKTVIDPKFPTINDYEFKTIKIIKNGEYWCSFARLTRRNDENIGLSIGSSKNVNSYLVGTDQNQLGLNSAKYECISVEGKLEARVEAYMARNVIYELDVQVLNKSPLKFKYYLDNQTFDIGTYDNSFKTNVTISRRTVFYPTVDFSIEGKNFIRFKWRLVHFNNN